MTKDNNKELIDKTKELFSAFATSLTPLGNNISTNNPWSADDVDKLEHEEIKGFRKLITACRFFYHKDPLSSTTINKLVEIGVTDVEITQSSLSDNEYKIFSTLKPKLKEFAEIMALEYLLTGLVVPEIQFNPVSREQLKSFDIKKYATVTMPTMMWLRDPSTITIEYSLLGPDPSYFVEVPDKLVYFVQHHGQYEDGNRDVDLYNKLAANYPEFVRDINSGSKKILLNNKHIFRRKVQSNSAYPIPYLESALESLYHKRNLRRMDYSLAARVISAILLFRLGDKDFPITADNQEELEAIKNQIFWRDGQGKNVERIFQLFANHTLQIDWIMPDIKALIDDTKYKDINQEIIFALGFPRILITGESERTGTSDPQFAMMSPIRTMENFRDRIQIVLQYIVDEVVRTNKLKYTPVVSFMPINLTAFKEYFDALSLLYNTGNVSRETYANALGIKWEDEMYKKSDENDLLKEKELGEFAPQAFSPQPGVPGEGTPTKPVKPTQTAQPNQKKPNNSGNKPK
jgi:hypothetical protein